MAHNATQGTPSCSVCGAILEAAWDSDVCPKCSTVAMPAADAGQAPTVLVDAAAASPGSPSVCGRCGAGLNGRGVLGYCPKCLLEGLDETPGDGVSESAQPEIPGYHFLRMLGRGGMGTVWLAEQIATKQRVAIKLCSRERLGAGGAALARFQREVELAARLNHPHIARVLGGGDVEGFAYYVMEYVEGGTLGTFVDERKPTVRNIIGMMRTVCEAVQHAHQNAIIHRDLKPSNIMVTADGVPKVVDFGLAKALEGGSAAHDISVSGQIIGTPRYMAPEQVGGDVADTRTDVYALGVILFELLTGEHPHDVSGTWEVLLRRIATEEPRRPRSIQPGLGSELEMLLLKALGRKPEDRYRTAGELADELGRWLRGEPLTAGRATPWYFARKWIARHRVAAAATAAILLLAAGATAFYVVNIRAERDKVVRSEKQTRRVLAESLAHNGELAAQRGLWKEALEHYDAALAAEHPDPPQVHLQRIAALDALDDNMEITSTLAVLEASPINERQRAQLDVHRAEREFRQGRTDEGVKLLKSIRPGLLEPGEQAFAEGLLAETFPDAIASFAKAVDAMPHHHGANAKLCVFLVLSGRHEEVSLRSAAAAALFPQDYTFPFAAAFASLMAGRPEEADRIFNDKCAKAPRRMREMFDLMRDAMRSADSMMQKIVRDEMGAGDSSASSHLMSILPIVMKARSIMNADGESTFVGNMMSTPLARSLSSDLLEVFTKGMLGKSKAALPAFERLAKTAPVGEVQILRGGFLRDIGDSKSGLALMRIAVKQPFLFPAVRRLALGTLAHEEAEAAKKPEEFVTAMEAYKQAAQLGAIRPVFALNGMAKATQLGETDFARWLMQYVPKDHEWLNSAAALVEEKSGNFSAAWKHIRLDPMIRSNNYANQILHEAARIGYHVRKMQMGMIEDAWKRMAEFEKRASEAPVVTGADQQFGMEVLHYRLMLDELGFESESRMMLDRFRAAVDGWVRREVEKGDFKAATPRAAEGFAVSWEILRESAEAERTLRDFLELQVGRHPEDVRIPHVETRLGDLLVKQRRFIDAEPFLVRAVPALQKEGSLAPRALADVCRNLVRVYARTEREKEAARWRSKVLTVLKDNQDLEPKAAPLKKLVTDVRGKPGTPGLAGELLKVFGFYVAEQRYEEAERWGREMVSFREKMHGDKWFTFKNKAELGHCLLAQERHAEAEPLLVAGCEGMLLRRELIPADARHVLGDNIQSLISLYDDTGRGGQAAEWRNRLWEIPKPAATKR